MRLDSMYAAVVRMLQHPTFCINVLLFYTTDHNTYTCTCRLYCNVVYDVIVGTILSHYICMKWLKMPHLVLVHMVSKCVHVHLVPYRTLLWPRSGTSKMILSLFQEHASTWRFPGTHYQVPSDCRYNFMCEVGDQEVSELREVWWEKLRIVRD